MDALDSLIIEIRRRPPGPDEALDAAYAALRQSHGDLREAVCARPGPWIFLADAELTVFATKAAPGTGSAPHSHGLWAVIACLAGQEGSRLYESRRERLVEAGRRRLVAEEAHALGDGAIHAVFNCWAEPNVVLHIYGGDFLAAPKSVYDPLDGSVYPLGHSEPLVPVAERAPA